MGHGCGDEMTVRTVTSYHNLRYCCKSLRGIRVGRAGRAEGWIMDGWIVVCK